MDDSIMSFYLRAVRIWWLMSVILLQERP